MKTSKPHPVRIGNLVVVGGGGPPALIAGPCVIESRAQCLRLAGKLTDWSRRFGVPLIFKASFDKANRTAGDAFRGPGLDAGLDILAEVRQTFDCAVLTDVHDPRQAERAAAVVDVIQIPAFLCRQTDLIVAAGQTGVPVNVKKAQFMAPDDMLNVIAKLEKTGNRKILLTERGTCFGYHDLVVDMRSLAIMRQSGYPVIFDATHSVQRPGAGSGCSGGDSQWIAVLARAAAGAGCDALFVETAVQPSRALCDGTNSVAWRHLPALWQQFIAIAAVVGSRGGSRLKGT